MSDSKDSSSGKNPDAAAKNIQLLSELNATLPTLLSSAGSALSLLTKPSSSTSHIEAPPGNEDIRKSLFEAHVTKYFTALKSLEDGLKKQVTALEEAGIIPAEPPAAVGQQAGAPMAGLAGSATGGGSTGDSGITNGGMGRFEVDWLNSQARDVGKQKEREVVRDAKEYLETLKTESGKKTEDVDVKDEVMGNG
jgi:hypothetical protein